MTLYYVAHRLFAAHDRALGAYIAGQLARRAGADAVFLPFCDTDEENLVGDCKGRRLFDLDRDRLRRIHGMIAVLHGPSLDDGVCMEIGYAAALGIPVVIVTTDFQTYGPGPGGPAFAFAEPLLEQIATTVVRAERLGPKRDHRHHDRFRAFFDQNLQPLRASSAQAVDALLAARPTVPPSCRDSPAAGRLAFIEPSPYHSDQIWDDVAAELHARNWATHIAQRFLANADTASATQADWAAACTASLAVVDTRGPETPPGAALITGACTATGRPVLAARTGSWLSFASGREPNWRNLMIQYGVSRDFTDISEFISALDGLPCPPT